MREAAASARPRVTDRAIQGQPISPATLLVGNLSPLGRHIW
jgi:hypothetical protein